MLERHGFFMGGDWRRATGSERIEVVNPTTEEPFGSIVAASAGDVDRTVGDADRAFRSGPWAETTLVSYSIPDTLAETLARAGGPGPVKERRS
jgi:acyl-CoA reductase-like NAD-dependent aldehyde dehydrogenase